MEGLQLWLLSCCLAVVLDTLQEEEALGACGAHFLVQLLLCLLCLPHVVVVPVVAAVAAAVVDGFASGGGGDVFGVGVVVFEVISAIKGPRVCLFFTPTGCRVSHLCLFVLPFPGKLHGRRTRSSLVLLSFAHVRIETFAAVVPRVGQIVSCAADGQVRLTNLSRSTSELLGEHEGRAHRLAIEPGSPHRFMTCGKVGTRGCVRIDVWWE